MERDASITLLLVSWSEGNPAALKELMPHVYRELRALAKSYLRWARPNQTLQPTALVHEAWLRLMDRRQLPRWENRAHFFGIAARLMRRVLVDYALAHHALKRGGAAIAVTLDEARVLSPVIEFRYFGGMEREEIATALGITVSTVKRDLRLGEAWLRRFLSSVNRT